MPRVTSEATRALWVEEAKSGKSPLEIAKAQGADPRTVKRVLDNHRREEVRAGELSALHREALRKHQDALLSFLVGMKDVFGPISPRLVLPGWADEIPDRVAFTTGYIDRLGTPVARVTLDVEESILWRLLQEHLGGGEIFSRVKAWKQAVVVEVRSRRELRSYVRLVLAGKGPGELGLAVKDDPSHMSSITQVAALQIEEWLVATMQDRHPTLLHVTVSDHGEMHIDAREPLAGRGRRGDQATKRRLAQLPELLLKGSPAATYQRSYNVAVKTGKQVQEAIDVIGAGFYIPGTCRACRI